MLSLFFIFFLIEASVGRLLFMVKLNYTVYLIYKMYVCFNGNEALLDTFIITYPLFFYLEKIYKYIIYNVLKTCFLFCFFQVLFT